LDELPPSLPGEPLAVIKEASFGDAKEEDTHENPFQATKAEDRLNLFESHDFKEDDFKGGFSQFASVQGEPEFEFHVEERKGEVQQPQVITTTQHYRNGMAIGGGLPTQTKFKQRKRGDNSEESMLMVHVKN